MKFTESPAWRRISSPGLLRWHLGVYALVIGLLTLLNVYVGSGWWAFWPTLGWSALITVHFLFVKSLNTDEEWAEYRALELKMNSYDFDHIDDIKRRVVRDDPSVRPADRR